MGIIQKIRRAAGYKELPALTSNKPKPGGPVKRTYMVECLLEFNDEVVCHFNVLQDAYSRQQSITLAQKRLKIKADSASVDVSRRNSYTVACIVELAGQPQRKFRVRQDATSRKKAKSLAKQSLKIKALSAIVAKTKN